MKQATPEPSKPWLRKAAPIVLVIVSLGVLISCVTVNRVVIIPPEIPGSKFVGSKNCAECHAQISKDFPTATHARLKAHGANAENIGCETCHGPGSVHSESGGARNTIVNPNKSPDVCFQCHMDMRGRFNLPHAHPVMHGKMSCSDCHDPHKGHATVGGPFMSVTSQSDHCAKCHVAQRGPFVFEHEATREGCTTCHDPHGTVNEKMLVQRNHNLCLKCHFQQQSAGRLLIGGRDHSAFVQRGTCWSAGCHEAIHGSHINSSLRF